MHLSVNLKKASLVGAFFVSLLCVDLAQAFVHTAQIWLRLPCARWSMATPCA